MSGETRDFKVKYNDELLEREKNHVPGNEPHTTVELNISRLYCSNPLIID